MRNRIASRKGTRRWYKSPTTTPPTVDATLEDQRPAYSIIRPTITDGRKQRKRRDRDGQSCYDRAQRDGKARGGGKDLINTDIWGTNVKTLSPELEVRESHDILHDFQQHLYRRRGQLINTGTTTSNRVNDNCHTSRRRIREIDHNSELRPQRIAAKAQSTN